METTEPIFPPHGRQVAAGAAAKRNETVTGTEGAAKVMHAFRLGARTIDLKAGSVSGGPTPDELTPTEVRLLQYLSQRSAEIVPREDLLVHVWGYSASVRSRTIDTTISRLRAKLEDDPSKPRFLHAVYGRGVRLDHLEPIEDEGTFATRFVGRREMVAVLAQIVRKSRLTTVWGPGGAGKSRLVAETLSRLAPGAVSVWCGAVSDGRDLDLAVAEALGVDKGADIGRILARAPVILALDECDAALQVVAGRVREWLSCAGQLRVIAVSRSELRLTGEQLFPVGPLENEEAIELFYDRARLREPLFEAPNERIERIVSLVDRLALAVEIAASRVHLIGIDRLETMLSAPLGEIDGLLGERIERSYVTLAVEDRHALVAASLLEAPFDIDDLAAVMGSPVERALRCVDAFVRQSLVSVSGGRYRLYRLVRDRARRDLTPDDPAHERHARWFGRLGTADFFGRGAARGVTWRSTADLRVAFRAAGDPALAIRCGMALLWCCSRQGRLAEGLAVAKQLDALPCTPSDRVALGNLIATLQGTAGDERAALSALERVVPLLSTPEEHVLTLCALATIRGRIGDVAGVHAALEAAAPHAPRATNYAQLLGTVAYHSRRPQDEVQMREALAIARVNENRLVQIECLGMLASTAYTRHADWEEGRRSFQRLLELCGTDESMTRSRVRAFVGFGQLERAQGDLDASEGYLEQAIALGERYGILDATQQARVWLARVWNQAGRSEDALGVVEPLALAERPPPHGMSARTLLVLAEIRERLGDRDAASRLLSRVLQHTSATPTDFAAESLDLLALFEDDEGRLSAADAIDNRPVARARRRVFASILSYRRGNMVRASLEREAAREEIARLGLLPDSDAALWLARSLEG